MKAFIYDCYDKRGEIKIKDKPIDTIISLKVSGDEYIVVFYEDGEQEIFDACDYTGAFRTMSFFDGYDRVRKDEIAAWAQMTKKERMARFSDE